MKTHEITERDKKSEVLYKAKIVPFEAKVGFEGQKSYTNNVILDTFFHTCLKNVLHKGKNCSEIVQKIGEGEVEKMKE